MHIIYLLFIRNQKNKIS